MPVFFPKPSLAFFLRVAKTIPTLTAFLFSLNWRALPCTYFLFVLVRGQIRFQRNSFKEVLSALQLFWAHLSNYVRLPALPFHWLAILSILYASNLVLLWYLAGMEKQNSRDWKLLLKRKRKVAIAIENNKCSGKDGERSITCLNRNKQNELHSWIEGRRRNSIPNN